MEFEKKQYSVTIFNEAYSLISDESEQHVQQAAQLVDRFIKEVVATSQTLSRDKVAVLVALRLASMLLKKETDIATINISHEQLLHYIDHAMHAYGEDVTVMQKYHFDKG